MNQNNGIGVKERASKVGESLAIIYTFYPYIDTSGNVFAKRINQDICEDITVITNKFVSNARLDHSLKVVVEPYLKDLIEIKTPFTYRDWKHFESFVDEAYKVYLEKLDSGFVFNKVYSRSMSVITHLVAYKIKKHNPKIKWIAEFSDPVVKDLEGNDKVVEIPVEWFRKNKITAEINNFDSNSNLFLLSELLVYLAADEIWYTNDIQKEFMLSYLESYSFNALAYSKLLDRIENITKVKAQPTLPTSYYNISELNVSLDKRYINIGYFGNFNASRDFDEFFNAWIRLVKSKKDKLRLYIFSNISEESIRKDIPIEFVNQIFVEKSLNYLDYLKVLNQFDYVVSIDTKVAAKFGCNPFLPSKISDYLGAKSQIFALIEKNSPVDLVVDSRIVKQIFGSVDLNVLFEKRK